MIRNGLSKGLAMIERDIVSYGAVQKGQFLIWYIRSMMITMILVVSVHVYLEWSIQRQQANNQFLQNQLMHGQRILSELKKQKEAELTITRELGFILSLRAKSFRSVHFLNELIHILPVNVSLTKATHEGNRIMLEGEAATDLGLDRLMQNVTYSTIFTQPILKGVSTDQNSDHTERYFQLQVTQQG